MARLGRRQPNRPIVYHPKAVAGTRQPPVYGTPAETIWSGGGAKSTSVGGTGSGSLSWNTGDVIVVFATTSNGNTTVGTPTATGLTFSAVGSPVGTVSSECWGHKWSATAGSPGSGVISATPAGASTWGMIAYVLSGSDGLGAESATTTPGTTKTAALTTTADRSAVLVLISDWNADPVTGYAWTPAGQSEREASQVGSSYTIYAADWPDRPAAAADYGITGGGSTGPFTRLAVEVLGAAAASGEDHALVAIAAAAGGVLAAAGRDTTATTPAAAAATAAATAARDMTGVARADTGGSVLAAAGHTIAGVARADAAGTVLAVIAGAFDFQLTARADAAGVVTAVVSHTLTGVARADAAAAAVDVAAHDLTGVIRADAAGGALAAFTHIVSGVSLAGAGAGALAVLAGANDYMIVCLASSGAGTLTVVTHAVTGVARADAAPSVVDVAAHLAALTARADAAGIAYFTPPPAYVETPWRFTWNEHKDDGAPWAEADGLQWREPT